MTSDSGAPPVHAGEVVAGEVVGGDALRPEVLEPILAPFAADSGIAIAVEDMDGKIIATSGAVPSDAPVDSIREIRCGPGKAAIGRVVGRGDGPIVEAVVGSLTNALAALAGTSHEHAPGGDAAHRLEAELALSRRIQRSLIPLTPPELRGFEVATHYEAAREVGGDFFDVFPLRERAGRAGVVIADVTGKGIAAALLMAFARPLMRSAIDQARDPLLALERTNSILVEERRSALFITALAGVLDLRTHVLRLANAGHEPPLFVPADRRRSISWLAPSGPLLGAFASLDLVPCEVSLGGGDLVLLYTDGVTDMRAASGERFGDERLVAVLEDTRGGSAHEVLHAVVEAVREFQGEQPAADDVTLVALRRTPRARRS